MYTQVQKCTYSTTARTSCNTIIKNQLNRLSQPMQVKPNERLHIKQLLLHVTMGTNVTISTKVTKVTMGTTVTIGTRVTIGTKVTSGTTVTCHCHDLSFGVYFLYTWCTREWCNGLGRTPIYRDSRVNHMFRNILLY